MPMQMEEARGFLFQALRSTRWSQVTDLTIAVGDLKAEAHGLKQSPSRQFIADGRGYLERGESALINEIIWSLIIQGILVPGLDDAMNYGRFFG